MDPRTDHGEGVLVGAALGAVPELDQVAVGDPIDADPLGRGEVVLGDVVDAVRPGPVVRRVEVVAAGAVEQHRAHGAHLLVGHVVGEVTGRRGELERAVRGQVLNLVGRAGVVGRARKGAVLQVEVAVEEHGRPRHRGGLGCRRGGDRQVVEPDLDHVPDRLAARRVRADQLERPVVLAVDLLGEGRAVHLRRDQVVRGPLDLLAGEGPAVPVAGDHGDAVALVGQGVVVGAGEVLVADLVVDQADQAPERHAAPLHAVRVGVAPGVAAGDPLGEVVARHGKVRVARELQRPGLIARGRRDREVREPDLGDIADRLAARRVGPDELERPVILAVDLLGQGAAVHEARDQEGGLGDLLVLGGPADLLAGEGLAEPVGRDHRDVVAEIDQGLVVRPDQHLVALLVVDQADQAPEGHAHPLDAVRVGVRLGVPTAGHPLVEVVARDREVRVPGHLQGPRHDVVRRCGVHGRRRRGCRGRQGHAVEPDLGDVADRLAARRVHADQAERPDVLTVDLGRERGPIQGVRDDVVRVERDLGAREGPAVPVGRDHGDGVALVQERPVEGDLPVLVAVVDVPDEPPEGHALPFAVGVRVAGAVTLPPEALLEVGLGDVALDGPVQQHRPVGRRGRVDLDLRDVPVRELGGRRQVVLAAVPAPVFRVHGLAHVLVAEDVEPVRVRRVVGPEEEADAVLIPVALAERPPGKHRRALPRQGGDDVVVGEPDREPVARGDLHLAAGLHAPDEVAEVLEVGPPDGLVHLVEVGVLGRVPLGRIGGSFVHHGALEEVGGGSVPEDGEVALHPGDVVGHLGRDGGAVARVADHLHLGRLRGGRGGHEQDEDQEQQDIGRSHR